MYNSGNFESNNMVKEKSRLKILEDRIDCKGQDNRIDTIERLLS